MRHLDILYVELLGHAAIYIYSLQEVPSLAILGKLPLRQQEESLALLLVTQKKAPHNLWFEI